MPNQLSHKKSPSPALIESIEAGSIACELGFEPGDKVISINGIKPRDLIDYKFLISEEEIEIEVLDKNDKTHLIQFEKNTDDNLGIVFSEALFDGLKQCNNNCSFCFIDQQPPGKRRSLYLKDDDYRMSFLYGSYLTLTNLSDDDWERIYSQNLSPLFVSVHATDPDTRARLLKNPKAGSIIKQIDWFSSKKLQIHAQVVVCPGLNDGKILRKTLIDLFNYADGEWPTVLSTAVVPVGLTRFRPDDDGLIPVDKECALKIIAEVEKLQKNFKKKIGSRFAWLSDEWYLIAQKNLPIRDSYEDMPQEENGVGSIRSFLEKLDEATKNLPKQISNPRRVTWVVGKMVKNALLPISQKLNDIENLYVDLYGLPSPYWGQDQVVTGLLTGKDLVEGLTDKSLGDELLIPSVMLKHDQSVFLDDMTIQDVSKSLKVNITVVHDAQEIVKAALG